MRVPSKNPATQTFPVDQQKKPDGWSISKNLI